MTNQPSINSAPPSPDEAYLWDPTQTPDPAVTEVEQRLTPLAYTPAPLALSARRTRSLRPYLLAAAVLLAISISWYFIRVGSTPRLGAWTIASQTGAITLDPPTGTKSGEAMITVNTGKVVLADEAGHRLFLETGTRLDLRPMHGAITPWAGSLFIETSTTAEPLAIAVNTSRRFIFSPGTAASVTLGANRAWRVTLKQGHARYIEGKQPPYRIPAEAVCTIDPDLGLIPPYFHDAPKALIDGLMTIQASLLKQPKAPSMDEGIDRVLKAARPRDAMTLWNLLPRVGDSARARIAAKLTQLAPEASKAAGPGLGNADQAAMDAWWTAEFP